MFTVQFKNHESNWSDLAIAQTYQTFEAAKERADEFYSNFTKEERDFYGEGCKPWIDDENGKEVYRPETKADQG